VPPPIYDELHAKQFDNSHPITKHVDHIWFLFGLACTSINKHKKISMFECFHKTKHYIFRQGVLFIHRHFVAHSRGVSIHWLTRLCPKICLKKNSRTGEFLRDKITADIWFTKAQAPCKRKLCVPILVRLVTWTCKLQTLPNQRTERTKKIEGIHVVYWLISLVINNPRFPSSSQLFWWKYCWIRYFHAEIPLCVCF
jgi:hypothetical protein